jgi:hypothetical protein
MRARTATICRLRVACCIRSCNESLLERFVANVAHRRQFYSTIRSFEILSSTSPFQSSSASFQSRRSFSTSAAASTKAKTSTSSASLLSLVKPFMLKCHPDVHQAASSKQINLQAIQNLNSFIDTIENAISSTKTTTPGRLPTSRLVEIDFVIDVEAQTASKKTPATTISRRKVELVLPLPLLEASLATANTNTNSHKTIQARLRHHAAREISKLLRVAGLAVPVLEDLDDADGMLDYFVGDDDAITSRYYSSQPRGTSHRPHFHTTQRPRRRPKTRYELNRDKFVSKINWQKYDDLYKEAVADMEADIRTHGSVGQRPHRRRKLIASILANVSLQQELSTLEQLICFRRLSLLLDEHFDKLMLEDFGRYWETCRIVLGPARPYNTSPSALHHRRLREAADASHGFSFTLHSDNTVTIVIPVDFRDDELIQELDRNVWDFYNIVGDGLDELFVRDEEVADG